jgi:hypothetical protein
VLDAEHARDPISIVIEGEAEGADTEARIWAEKRGIPVDPYPAAWTDLSHPDAIIKVRRNGTKYDAKAGYRRNAKMLAKGMPDVVIAFPGGSGTRQMCSLAEKAGVEVRRY